MSEFYHDRDCKEASCDKGRVLLSQFHEQCCNCIAKRDRRNKEAKAQAEKDKANANRPAPPGFHMFDFSKPGEPMFEVFFAYEDDGRTTFDTEAEAAAAIRRHQKLVHDEYRRREGLDG